MLFKQIVVVKLELDMITYKATISACDRGGEWQWALWLLYEMKDATGTDAMSQSIAICASETAGAQPQAISSLRLVNR